MDAMSSPSPEAAVKPLKGPRGNKRARLVCLRCHEKKIKCDLQANNTERDSPRCTKCELAGYECRIRPSKRGGGNHSANKASSLDGFDNSGMMPLLPMAYDAQAPSITGVGGASVSSMGLGNGKPGSNIDVAGHDESLIAHGNVPHLSPHAERQSAHSRSRKVPSAQHALTQGVGATPNEPRDVADQNPSYIGESGYMEIFREDRTPQIDRSESSQPPLRQYATDLPPPALQESFIETYFEYCYTWCPILERSSFLREPGVRDSILLKQALALLGSRIEPPVIPHARPSVYYERAKSLFYGNYEKNPITSLRALCLFYYWGSAPNTISLDTVWWWTGVAIRQAQQIGLHREPKPGYPMRFNESLGLRRRIWWTLFARERLTSICQGRPCIIDPSDCNVQEPTIEDFPEPRNVFRAQIFIHWVRLCGIVGRVAKYLSQRTESTQFPTHLARELIDWIQTLPEELHLPIATNRTTPFSRDIHQLHLPYLTTITLLYLAKSSHPLPRAYTAAVLSASCVARIFEDYLARGSIRFLQGMAGWHISVAILALLHARRVESLTEAADNHIRLLRIALKEMAKMWHSASMFDKGFNRLLGGSEFHVSDARLATNGVDLRAGGGSLSELADLATGNLINWMDFFPFATVQTSPLVEILLTQNSSMTFSDVEWPSDLALQLHDLFDTFEGTNDGVFGLAG